jgi:hypothetical protein
MRLKRTILITIFAAVIVLATGAGSAHAADKPDLPEVGGQPAVPADTVDAAAAPAVSPAISQASAVIQSRIVDHVQTHGTKYTFGAYADALTGKVVLETDAPPDVVSSLVGEQAGMVEVRDQTVADNFSRRDDIAPFWGGAGIRNTTTGGICTSGYTVRNSAGTRFMVTAGHCLANGQTAVTELGNRVYGTARGNGLPGRDMVLLGGQSYGAAIYVGGVNSSTGHRVASAADPRVGFNNYCHSGRTTGEHCGHTVSSVTGTVCTSSGCKSPVVVFSGGVLPQAGDSGAPFYALSVSGSPKHIRGHVIAASGSTRYAEKWSRVRDFYGVSIVT